MEKVKLNCQDYYRFFNHLSKSKTIGTLSVGHGHAEDNWCGSINLIQGNTGGLIAAINQLVIQHQLVSPEDETGFNEFTYYQLDEKNKPVKVLHYKMDSHYITVNFHDKTLMDAFEKKIADYREEVINAQWQDQISIHSIF